MKLTPEGIRDREAWKRAGIGASVERFFREELAGKGAVRETLRRRLG